MRKLKSLKPTGILLLFLLILFACKKANQQNEIGLEQTIQERSLDLLKKKIEKDGRNYEMAHNVKVASYAVDQNENRLSAKDLKSHKNTRLFSSCVDVNGDPIFGFDETVLESCTAYYQCGSGYQITTSWLLTTPLPLTTTGTKGKIRLKNTSGTITYTNLNITPVTITALSQTNLNFPADIVYRVTFISPYIEEATFQGAVILENAALLATTCSQGPQAISYLSSYVLYIGTIFTSPCLRVDLVSINPPSSGFYGGIAGCNAGATCNWQYGYILPNTQDVEFTAVSGGAVNRTVNIRNFAALTIVPVTASANLPTDNSIHIYLYSGTYTIRYRNNSNCNPDAPWSMVKGPYTF